MNVGLCVYIAVSILFLIVIIKGASMLLNKLDRVINNMIALNNNICDIKNTLRSGDDK